MTINSTNCRFIGETSWYFYNFYNLIQFKWSLFVDTIQYLRLIKNCLPTTNLTPSTPQLLRIQLLTWWENIQKPTNGGFPVETGRKLNVNTFNLRPVSTGLWKLITLAFFTSCSISVIKSQQLNYLQKKFLSKIQ